jgi:diguanylate cyclase (GGDEF)-like protein
MAKRIVTIRVATAITVVFICGLFILFSWSAGSYFRAAALQSQTQSLSRIIEVAGNQVLRDIEQHVLSLHSTLNNDTGLAGAFSLYQATGESAEILNVLDDPLVNGFPGMVDIELVKLRIHDLDLKLLLESRAGIQALPPHLPNFIIATASKRSGVDRLKATGGLWVSSQGPLYSILAPIGGLRLEGYLELIIDPTYSLTKVSDITGMPVTISPAGTSTANISTDIEGDGLLPIEYLLIGNDNQPAYHLKGKEDVSQLYRDMHNTQLITTAAFVTITFVILLTVLLLLNHGIFKPLKRILHGIERYRCGELDVHIRPSGLSELFTLSDILNIMIEQIRHDIDVLERYSQSDGLTGLGNRRYFEQRLMEEWSRAIRQQWPVSLLFIDIDYFKRYNDHYGHLQGDDCLRRVAKAIQQAVKREFDVAARYGGEEFIIMLPDTDLTGAERVARELQQAIRRLHIEHPGSNVEPFVTLSIGIAGRIPQFPEKPETLLQAADIALYEAKEHGRNRIGKSATA